MGKIPINTKILEISWKKNKKKFFFEKTPPNPFLKFWNFPRFDFYSTIGALWAFLKKNGNITFSLKMICSPLHIVLTIPHHLNCPHTPLNPLFQCLIEYILKIVIFSLLFKFPICDPLKQCLVHSKTGLCLSIDIFQFIINFL